jgi:hypothetical protein
LHTATASRREHGETVCVPWTHHWRLFPFELRGGAVAADGNVDSLT